MCYLCGISTSDPNTGEGGGTCNDINELCFMYPYVKYYCCVLSGFIVGIVFLILYLSAPDDSSSVITNHTNATVAGRTLVQLAEIGVVAATKILRG